MKNSIIKKKLKENLINSWKGWKIWHKISHKDLNENCMAILLPEKDENICRCSALYLNDLLIQSRKEKAVFISCDTNITRYAKMYTNNVIKILEISENDAHNLMQFYRLYNFDNRFLIASFRQPFGRNGDKALQMYPKEFDELFALCIYKLKPYTSQIEEKLKKI